MQYVITIILLIAVVATGLLGYQLFQSYQFNLSHLPIIASYACIVGTIYYLTVYRQRHIH